MQTGHRLECKACEVLKLVLSTLCYQQLERGRGDLADIEQSQRRIGNGSHMSLGRKRTENDATTLGQHQIAMRSSYQQTW